MDTVLRAVAVYATLLVLFRAAGRKTLANMTTFDFVLTLIISEAVQQALIDNDESFTAAALLVTTLIGLDVALSYLKNRSALLSRVTESVPLLLVEDGIVNQERCRKERIDLEDILGAAREAHGLERLDQVKHAILEKSGTISIVPRAATA